jgi:hypothetical protein
MTAPATRDEIVSCYRILLGREPDDTSLKVILVQVCRLNLWSADF